MREDPSIVRGEVLIVGASHEAALHNAWKLDRRPNYRFVNFWDVHFKGGDFSDVLAKQRASGSCPLICLAFGSNAHNRVCLIEGPEPFSTSDELGQIVPKDSAGRRFIPFALMREHLRRQSNLMLTLAAQVHDSFPASRFVHLCTPPPVLTVPQVTGLDELPEEQRTFLTLLASRPPPSSLRLQVWRIQRDIYLEDARRRGATLLDPPAEALTHDGFLAPEFMADADPSHANASYGALVLDQVAKTLREEA